MIFVDERLPMDVEAGAKATPSYATDVIVTDGGWEVRNSRWRYPLFKFTITAFEPVADDGTAGIDDLDEFLDIFHVVGGSEGAFRFHWWREKPVAGQQIGVGDGSTTEFQLYRTYTRGSFSRDRKITRPIVGSVTVYENGAPVSAGIDYDTGVVIFGAAPALGVVITADFDYDVPVRFADDSLDVVGLTSDLDQVVNVTLIEIRE